MLTLKKTGMSFYDVLRDGEKVGVVNALPRYVGGGWMYKVLSGLSGLSRTREEAVVEIDELTKPSTGGSDA
jgi:hypothetical protein